MDEDYTPEQKAKIARHFVYVAPHGEVHDVVKDLKKVVNDDNILSERWLYDSMTEYNKRRFEIVEGDNSKIIACPQSEVEPNKYLHPDKGLICEIDPVKQKIVNEFDAQDSVGGQFEEYRQNIAAKLKEYTGDFYEDGSTPNSNAKGTAFAFVSPGGQVAIVISFKNLNPSNYWTGGWQSEWTINVADTGIQKMEGRIRINVHYYEEGNVQLNSSFNQTCEVEVEGPEETAERIVNTIQTFENEFQGKLDHFYVQMHDSTFKNMRRFLPKTGTKMDWRSSVHNLVKESASK